MDNNEEKKRKLWNNRPSLFLIIIDIYKRFNVDSGLLVRNLIQFR